MSNKLMPWSYSLGAQLKAVGAGVSAAVVSAVSVPGFRPDRDGWKSVLAAIATYLVTFYLRNKKDTN